MDYSRWIIKSEMSQDSSVVLFREKGFVISQEDASRSQPLIDPVLNVLI